MDLKQKITDFKANHPGITQELPTKLPTDLNAITAPGGLISEATTAYCATQHPELYYVSAAGGAVGGVALALVVCFGARKLFGCKAKAKAEPVVAAVALTPPPAPNAASAPLTPPPAPVVPPAPAAPTTPPSA